MDQRGQKDHSDSDLPDPPENSDCFTPREIDVVRRNYSVLPPGGEATPLLGWDVPVLGIDSDYPPGPFTPRGLRDPRSGQLPETTSPLEFCPPASSCTGPDGLANYELALASRPAYRGDATVTARWTVVAVATPYEDVPTVADVEVRTGDQARVSSPRDCD